MKFHFNVLRTTRRNILNATEGLSLEQINTIPAGFSNNIAWNLTHLIATQQLLVYGLSGTPFVVDTDLIETYRKGTKPQKQVTVSEWELYKKLLLTTVDQAEQDYNNGILGSDFKVYTTSYNITLNSLENAITFNNVHEGLHYGTIRALLKLTMNDVMSGYACTVKGISSKRGYAIVKDSLPLRIKYFSPRGGM